MGAAIPQRLQSRRKRTYPCLWSGPQNLACSPNIAALPASTTCRKSWAGCGLDADGDGDLDALFVRGHNLEELADAESQNRFFRNTGEGQFVDDTTNAGLTDLGYSYGVTCGDVDADGDIDLYITNFGKDCLYYNDGTGRFTKAPEADSAALDDFSVSSCFLDYDRDGDLDLFVTRYWDWSGDIGGGCFNLRGGRLLQPSEKGSFTDCCKTTGKDSSPM